MTIYADDEFKLGQVDEVLLNKFAKRGVDIRSIEKGKSEKIGGDKVKRIDKLKEGLESELAKKSSVAQGQQDEGHRLHPGAQRCASPATRRMTCRPRWP